MEIYFVDGGLEIKSTDFHTYDISNMKEENLNQIAKKCLNLVRTKNGNEFEAAKEMLKLISEEKNFRAVKESNSISIRNLETAKINSVEASRWSKLAVGAVIFVGLLQAFATLREKNCPILEVNYGPKYWPDTLSKE